MCSCLRTQRKANILLLKILEKLMDKERKAYILPKKKLEEVNLGVDPRNSGPILISSQLSVYKKRATSGAIKKNMKICWRELLQIK